MQLTISGLEICGAVTGAICVYYVLKRNIWNFPFGIVSSGFYVVFFFEHKLYWEMLLQFVMIALSALGWYWWPRRLREGNAVRPELPVTMTPLPLLVGSVAFTVVSTPIMMRLSQSVGGAAPFWDSLIAALSLVAQTLLG